MRVVRDVPGQSLVLKGADARQLWNFGVLLAIPGIPCLLLAMVSPVLLLPFLLMLVVMCVGDHQRRGVQFVSLDRAQGGVHVEERSPLGLAGGRAWIPFSKIRALSLRIDAKGNPLGGSDLTLRLTFLGDPARGESKSCTIRVVALDRRDEMVDLALRMARIIGLGYYQTTDGPEGLTVLASRGRDDGASSAALYAKPVPLADGPSDYVIDGLTEIAAPTPVTAPFEPSDLLSDFRVKEWQPGQRVLLVRDFNSLDFTVGLLAATAAVGLVTACVWGGRGSVSHPYPPLSFLLGVAPFEGVAVLAIFLFAAPQTTLIDWTLRIISVSHWRRSAVIPFDGLTMLELRCVRRRRSERTSGHSHLYYNVFRCEVRAISKSGSCRLVDTHEFRENPAMPYESILRLAVDLSRAISVPLEIVDYR